MIYTTIYTTGWAIQATEVSSEYNYKRWLESLKDGDEVLLQHMYKPDNGGLSISFERWLFVRYRINRDLLTGAGGYEDRPFKPADGKACYYNSNYDWGEVFPARIVLMSPRHENQRGWRSCVGAAACLRAAVLLLLPAPRVSRIRP